MALKQTEDLTGLKNSTDKISSDTYHKGIFWPFCVPEIYMRIINANENKASYRLNVTPERLLTYEELLTLCFITLMFHHSQMAFLMTVTVNVLVKVPIAETAPKNGFS